MIDPKLRQRLTGVFTALVTPFRSGAVDKPALERLIATRSEIVLDWPDAPPRIA